MRPTRGRHAWDTQQLQHVAFAIVGLVCHSTDVGDDIGLSRFRAKGPAMSTLSDVRILAAIAQLRAMELSADELRALYDRVSAKRFDRASYATIAVACDTILRGIG